METKRRQEYQEICRVPADYLCLENLQWFKRYNCVKLDNISPEIALGHLLLFGTSLLSNKIADTGGFLKILQGYCENNKKTRISEILNLYLTLTNLTCLRSYSCVWWYFQKITTHKGQAVIFCLTIDGFLHVNTQFERKIKFCLILASHKKTKINGKICNSRHPWIPQNTAGFLRKQQKKETRISEICTVLPAYLCWENKMP